MKTKPERVDKRKVSTVLPVEDYQLLYRHSGLSKTPLAKIVADALEPLLKKLRGEK